jgi:glycosyltransferase involved in cell wall biosynthesis
LTSKGHDITVVTLRLPGTEAFEIINGVKVHRVKVPNRGARYWFTFLSIPKVFQLAKKADLVHTTTYNGAFPGWLASKLRGKKSLITVLEVFGSRWVDLADMNWFVAKLHQLLEYLVIVLPFDRHISISRYTSQCLKDFGIARGKTEAIYCGIDYDLFNPAKADGKSVRQKLKLGKGFIYMYYGRPGISKGVEYLVRAVPLIIQQIPDSKLVLILADDPRDRYENIKRMVNKLKLEDNVILLDPVPRDELPSYIAASDCVVVPSLSEGFGFTAAEACAMGKPVIASNVASLPEVVSGKYILVEPGHPEAIAKAVSSVYNSELSGGSKKTFSWDKCVDSYVKVYNELVSVSGKGS